MASARLHLGLLGLVVLGSACASNISSVQPARLVPAGHTEVRFVASGTPPAGLADDSAEGLRLASELGSRPSEAEVRQASSAAIVALGTAPSVNTRLSVTHGISRRVELGAHAGSSDAGVSLRLQWMRRRPGIYGALGLSLSGGWNALLIDRFADEVAIRGYRRFDIGVPLVLGYSRRRIHIWGGPKVQFGWSGTEVELCPQGSDRCPSPIRLEASQRSTTLAGQFGFAFGGSSIWFAVELSVGRTWVSGEGSLEMQGMSRNIEAEGSGLVLTPAFGIIGWI